jgi:hypothetical protein
MCTRRPPEISCLDRLAEVIGMLKIERRYLLVPLWAAAMTLCAGGATGIAAEAEYAAVPLEEGPPKDELAPPIAESLEATGIAVKRGENRTVCELWLCKKWQVQADFKPTLQLLYPFKEGELIGVIRYPRRGNDFRDQQIASGVYTLRYALQPVDGNHVGTSPTRDFFLMVPAEWDKSIEPIEVEELSLQSTEASQTAHPALLALQEVQKDVSKLPAMRHDESRDWWILQFAGNSGAEGKSGDIRVDLVVVGHAAE